jgi:HK97 family phage prohead protease
MDREQTILQERSTAINKPEVVSIVRGIVADYGIASDHNQIFVSGSFDEWLQKDCVIPLLFEHKPHLQAGEVLGFKSLENGLWVEAVLFDTPTGRDLKRLIDAKLLDSFSILYSYSPTKNPEPEFARPRLINTVHEVEEVSLVLQPGGVGAVMEGTKQRRETNYIDYLDRMDRFWRVDSRLEVTGIHDFVFERWRHVYRNYSNRKLYNQSMEI